ncbi:MAG: methylmalonyl-CoA epimerase [Planctomycetaceae bacterium]|nr:methylmalonyl-CoA epimerase [Planctomycetota bacterium]NUN52475.1 methylmalonyl-CoA epimerase [Planctomycetaceae bacterium]
MHLDHVGIALEDAKEGADLFRRLFGLPLALERTVPDQGVKVVKLSSGESYCEFLEPLSPDTPVGRFLAKRGGGLHHVCFAVPDIRAAIADLVGKGAAMIDREPRTGAAGLPIAFLQPSSTAGILVELVERK